MRNSAFFRLAFAVAFMAIAGTSHAQTLIDIDFTAPSGAPKTGFAATGVSNTDFWNIATPPGSSNLAYVNGVASGVALTYVPGTPSDYPVATNGSSDPMYGQYIYSIRNPDTFTISNLPAGAYGFFLYGHGLSDNQNTVFDLNVGSQDDGTLATTNGSGWLSPIWQEGVQYVEFTAAVAAGQLVTITVEAGADYYAVFSGLQIVPVGPLDSNPYIVTQPSGQYELSGGSATFAVVAGGATPLAYQWLLNNAPIADATNSSFTVTNAQTKSNGLYSVIVSNAYQTITSSVVVLEVIASAQTALIDVAFTGATVTGKTGFAAVGIAPNDFWNTDDGDTLANLAYVDGTASGAGLTITNVRGSQSDGAFDPMLAAYLFSASRNLVVTVTNLTAGAYDFYLYGHGSLDNEGAVFQFTSGSLNYGTEITTNGAAWRSPVWQEGLQFAEFTNVSVLAGQPVTIAVGAGDGILAALSGLQIASVGAPGTSPYIVSNPPKQVVSPGETASFSIVAGGTPPLSYQWLFENVPIPGATNISYNLTNAQLANVGYYSVIVSNTYRTVNSMPAVLGVFSPGAAKVIDVAFGANPVTAEKGFAAAGLSADDFWNAFNGPPFLNLQYVDGTPSGTAVTVTNVEWAYSDTAFDPMYASYLFDEYGDLSLTVSNLAAGIYDFYLYGHGDQDNQNSIFQLQVGPLDEGMEATTNGAGWLSPVWQERVQYVEFTNVVVVAGAVITVTVNPGAGDYAVLSGLQIVSLPPGQPFIVSSPPDQEISPGTTTTFSTSAGGTPPLAYQWLFNDTPVSGATNSSYTVANAQATNAGNYVVVVTNAFGSTTSAAAILEVSSGATNTLIDVDFVNVAETGSTNKMGPAATGLFANDLWNIVLAPGLANLAFVDGTVSSAALTLTPSDSYSYPIKANGATDPMYGLYVYSVGNPDSIAVTNLPAGAYDFYLYGHGNVDDQNTVFQLSVGSLNYGLEATTNGPGWLSPVWQEGVQYVEFTNVSVLSGQPVTIQVNPGAGGYAVFSGLQIATAGLPGSSPYFLVQPTDQAAVPGTTAYFSVVAEGAAPLAYQWLFNGVPVFGATNNSLAVTNAQAANSGGYSVIVSNAHRNIASVTVGLNLTPGAMAVIDATFTGTAIGGKTGFAAIGVSGNDFWNIIGPAGLGNLAYVNGTSSGAALNFFSSYSAHYPVIANGASDPMYGQYIYDNGSSFTVTVTNLIAGAYDFYLYGHGGADSLNGAYQLTVGSQSYGIQATTNGSGWLSPVWQEGVQYVEFTNVSVPNGQPVTFTVNPGAAGYALLSGLQIAAVVPPGTSPFIVSPLEDEAVLQGASTTLAIEAEGSVPLACQWLFDNIPIATATNLSYAVLDAQSSNAGYYSIAVSNLYGSITSLVAVLGVVAPVAPKLIDVAFTGSLITQKTGFAAIGLAPNDFWNTCYLNLPDLPNLMFADGTASGAGLTVSNVEGASSDTAFDPMYASYFFRDYENITVTVTNLTTGVYHVYLYGHGNTSYEISVSQISAGGYSFGSAATTGGSTGSSPFWQEGVQYVEFTNVVVANGQSLIITVGPTGGVVAELSGLQIESFGLPLIVAPSNQFVSVNQELTLTNVALSANGPITFALASNAPAGASITPGGVFGWVPGCEQGSTTNLITVWATDSSTPPLSNSISFSVVVGDCVEVSIGSSATPSGQGVCVPVSLTSTVPLTNLSFDLATPGGYLTNWSVSSTNSAIATVTVGTANPAVAQFDFGVHNGQTLQGASVLGTICLDTLPGQSVFLPLSVTGFGATTADNRAVVLTESQNGRIVIVGNRPLLEAALGANSSRLLTLYGRPGTNYNVLSTSDLTSTNTWTVATNLTLSRFFQTMTFAPGTNQSQFYQAVQH